MDAARRLDASTMGGMKVAEHEEDFERASPRPEPAAPASLADARFRLVAHVAAFLAAACAGATVYVLGTSGLREGALPAVDAWMGVGAAVAVGLALVVLKKLSPRLGYLKPGQGRWARLSAYAGIAVIALFGAVALHKLPELGSKWFLGEGGLWSRQILGSKFVLRPVLFPAAGFFLATMVAFHLFVNRPKPADFMIETQGEMKRVSWPTRREWIGSTLVVVVLVTILAFFLYGVDSLLSPVMQKFRIGF